MDISEKSIKDALGRKYKSIIISSYSLLLFIREHYNKKKGMVELCQNNTELLSVYSNLHNNISYLIKIGVLEEITTQKYQVGIHSKKYIVYSEALKYTLTLSKEWGGIDLRQKEGVNGETEEANDIGLEHLINVKSKEQDQSAANGSRISVLNYHGKCDFGSRLRIDTTRYDITDLEKRIRIDNPLFEVYAKKADALNASIPNPREKIRYAINVRLSSLKYIDENGKRFYPHEVDEEKKKQCRVECGRYIVKIGARATNGICYLKSQENNRKRLGEQWEPEPYTEYREDYLGTRFGQDNWEEYDVHASVPRIAHFLRSADEEFGDMNEDLYTTLFGTFYQHYNKFVADHNLTNVLDARSYFKSLFLRLCFSPSASAVLTQLVKAEENQQRRREEKMSEGKILPIDAMDTPFWTHLKKQDLCEAQRMISELKSIVDDFCRPTDPMLRYNNDTKIFVHESNIYLDVRAELMRRNIDVVQVYDGFFFRRGTMPADMDDIIRDCAHKYKKRLFSGQIRDEIRSFKYRPKYDKQYYLDHIDDPKTILMLIAYLFDIIRNSLYFSTEENAEVLEMFFQRLLDSCPVSRYNPDGTKDEAFETDVVDVMCGYVVEMRHLLDEIMRQHFRIVGDTQTHIISKKEKERFIHFVFNVKDGKPFKALRNIPSEYKKHYSNFIEMLL